MQNTMFACCAEGWVNISNAMRPTRLYRRAVKCNNDINIWSHLRHERFQVLVVLLTDYPMGIATKRPARDRSHQGLLVRQPQDQMWNQLGQVRRHAVHAALGDGPQNKDPRLLYLPAIVEEGFLEDGKQNGENVIAKHVG